MKNFSLAELMIVVSAIAFTAAGVGLRDASQDAIALVAALAMGLAVAGPPLLWWRHRRGLLPHSLGLGELAWLGLGLYFLPLVLWNLVSPADRVSAESWLLVALVLSGTITLAAAILGFVRGLMWLFGAPLPVQRDWFAPRWTNLLGGLLVLLYTVLAGLAAYFR